VFRFNIEDDKKGQNISCQSPFKPLHEWVSKSCCNQNLKKKEKKLLTSETFGNHFMWLIAAFINPFTTAFVSLQENQQKFVSFFVEAVSKSVNKYRTNCRVKKFFT
jgi:hypothetical protein